MLHEAVSYYHELLSKDNLAEDSRALLDEGLERSKLIFGGRRLSPYLRPHFVSETDFARITARRMASETASAAKAPIAVTSARVEDEPVDSANRVSPSAIVCAGLMARAMPSCDISAIFFICALVNPAALVATTPMVVA